MGFIFMQVSCVISRNYFSHIVMLAVGFLLHIRLSTQLIIYKHSSQAVIDCLFVGNHTDFSY